MKILLDECLPRKLAKLLPLHECWTVPQAGFAGKKNGALLDLAEASQFALFLTIDQGIPYQQKLAGRKLAIVVIRARSNRLVDVAAVVSEFLDSINATAPGTVAYIGR
ncbi:MAG: DUF5615 family PIN-like protein [Acidobacteria bacterium]|nr:DUF5615 family PIN-like protein [Acidobacteriota bacterium]